MFVMTAMAYVDETKDDTYSTPYLQKPDVNAQLRFTTIPPGLVLKRH